MKSIFKKSTLILIVSLAGLLSCQRDQNVFSISGNISGLGNDTILVVGFDSRFDCVDTIFSINGRFEYSTRIDTVVPIFLFYKSNNTEDIIFADKGLKTQVEGDIRDLRRTITGGNLNYQLNEFMDSAVKDTSTLMARVRVETYITENPFSEINAYLLFNYCLRHAEFNADYVNRMIGKMSGTMQDNFIISEIKPLVNPPNRPETFLPEHILFDTADVAHSFRSLITQGHGLLCFWSSWDMESRNKMREIEGLSKKYNDRIFKIIGISIDTQKERWKNAVREDSCEWSQLCDFQGWEGKFIPTLKPKEIPCFIVVNPQQRIILMSGSINEIDQKLSTLLIKKNTK